jgi:hypothetical protein
VVPLSNRQAIAIINKGTDSNAEELARQRAINFLVVLTWIGQTPYITLEKEGNNHQTLWMIAAFQSALDERIEQFVRGAFSPGHH